MKIFSQNLRSRHWDETVRTKKRQTAQLSAILAVFELGSGTKFVGGAPRNTATGARLKNDKNQQ